MIIQKILEEFYKMLFDVLFYMRKKSEQNSFRQ